jgi:O-antigen ligase
VQISDTEPTIRSRAGDVGSLLTTGGLFLFCLASPVSIATSQIGWGICVLGLIIGFATGRIRYRPTPLDLPLLIYIIVDIASVLTAVDRPRSAHQILGDWTLLYLPVFVQAFRSSRDVRRGYTLLMITSTIVAAYAVWQMFAGRDLLRHHPLEPNGGLFLAIGFFGHHLTYGGNVLITSLLAMVLASRASRSGRAILVRGGAATIQFAAVVASFARTVWIGAVAGIVTAALTARGTLRWISAAALVAAGAFAFLLPATRARVLSIAGLGDDPRARLWHTALRIWRAHPILGAGPGSFGPLFPFYKVPGTYMATGHPHNDFLNIMVQSGIIGLLAFAFIWVRYFRLLWKARRLAGPHDPRGAIIVSGIVIVIGFFAGAMGQCFLTDEEVGMLFWLIVAGSVVVAREVMEEAASETGQEPRAF